MTSNVAPRLHHLPKAPSPAAKPAELAIDDATMRERLKQYLCAEAGNAVEVETFERRSPGFSWITYIASRRATSPASGAN
jgi:hypothetical protein